MIDVSDLPPQMQERVVCSIAAANKYQLPANILLAVAEREGGKPGQWVRNKNGTHDVGSMQFNTAYLRSLERYGITPEAVAQPGCYSYYLAAWRIKRHIVYDKNGDIWTKVANYHSYTPRYNTIYRAAIIPLANKWANWLNQRMSNVVPASATNANPTTQVHSSPRQRRPTRLPSTQQQPHFTHSGYVPRTIRVATPTQEPNSQ